MHRRGASVMQPELSEHEYPERTVRQVAADARRALARNGWCTDRSRIDRLRCEDDLAETEYVYGRQLWLFEAHAVDAYQERTPGRVFGAVEYSVQYGYLEPVLDGVFDSDNERRRYVSMSYQGISPRPAYRWQVLRWLLVGLFFCVFAAYVVYLIHHWMVAVG